MLCRFGRGAKVLEVLGEVMALLFAISAFLTTLAVLPKFFFLEFNSGRLVPESNRAWGDCLPTYACTSNGTFASTACALYT